MRARAAGWRTAGIALLALSGCGGDPGASPRAAEWLAEEGARVQALGWLGARAHPADRSVEVPLEAGSTEVAGGMVVTEVLEAGPLAAAGAERGDVIVRVGEDGWLPNKEDPGLDLMRALEAEVSSGVDPIELGLLRGGQPRTVQVSHGRSPLEVGLPGPSDRLGEMARAGLDRLAELGAADPSLGAGGSADADAAISSLAGLAFLGGGSAEEGAAHAGDLARCRDRVPALVRDQGSQLGPWGAALAVMFLAELAGPLELEPRMIAMSTDALTVSGGEGIDWPADMPEGTIVYGIQTGGGGDLPVDLEEILSDLGGLEGGGEIQISVVGGPPGQPLELASASGGEEPPAAEPVDGPLWTPEELALLAGDETVARLELLSLAVDRLLSLQLESGGWDPAEEGMAFSDSTLATNQALLALGMAERAGAPAPCEAIRRGLAFVRSHTNDGHVFYVDTPGFDRRREAGRAAGAAAALRALNCRETESFLSELTVYADRHAGDLPSADAGVPLHVLNAAVLRRQRGPDAWAAFYRDFRYLLVALQDPDGSFAPCPGTAPAGPGLDPFLAGGAARTALWSLVLGLQSERLPVLGARARNPLQSPMDAEGLRVPSGFSEAAGAVLQRVIEGAGAERGASDGQEAGEGEGE